MNNPKAKIPSQMLNNHLTFLQVVWLRVRRVAILKFRHFRQFSCLSGLGKYNLSILYVNPNISAICHVTTQDL
jgi:hypothetical protein